MPDETESLDIISTIKDNALAFVLGWVMGAGYIQDMISDVLGVI